MLVHLAIGMGIISSHIYLQKCGFAAAFVSSAQLAVRIFPGRFQRENSLISLFKKVLDSLGRTGFVALVLEPPLKLGFVLVVVVIVQLKV